MPVFDFSDTPNEKKDPECTYEVFYSNESEATPENPKFRRNFYQSK